MIFLSENTSGNSSFKEKIENFFYHYKWHTLVALFLVFTIVICSFQMCTKASYDVHIMYAGGEDIAKTASGGDISEYQKLCTALSKYIEDFDGDGAGTVNLLTLFIPSAEEIDRVENGEEGLEINTTLVMENTNTFEHNILYSEYVVCFISRDLFDKWSDNGDVQIFAEIAPYTNGNEADYSFVGKYGISLGSTDLYESKAGMKLLPEDTVICIRAMSEVSSRFNKAKNRENYRRSEALIRALLADG